MKKYPLLTKSEMLKSIQNAKLSKRRIGVGVVLFTVTVTVVGTIYWQIYREPPGTADPTDVAQVALGERVYAAHCATCHGVKLKGQPNWRTRKSDGYLPAPPHDETGHTWHHPDEHLFQITKNGVKSFIESKNYKSEMPTFGSILSDEEIWAALAFIKSTWPVKFQNRQKSISERSKP